MQLHDLAATSTAVAGVAARLEKIDRLAARLRRLAPEEIEIAVACLSGSPRQRRMGVGPSILWEMKATPAAAAPSLEIARDRWTVYVRPELVVEIAFNDLQESPHYPGGLALRFARVKRYRTDKSAGEADTLDRVRAIFRRTTGREPARSHAQQPGELR